MNTDERYIPSFVANRDTNDYTGAVYAMRPGYGPELLLCCDHHHASMWKAMDCAAECLAWAGKVVALAERYQGVEP